MRPEINYKKKNYQKKKKKQPTNTWRINYILLNKQWVPEEIKEEIKTYPKMNENGSTTIQNLRDQAKAALRGKFIIIQVYLRKQEKS